MQTNKEALLALLKGEKADFIPEVYSTMKDVVFPGDRYIELGDKFDPYGTGPDAWGVLWTNQGPDPVIDGNMVAKDFKLFDDMDEWKEKVKFPPLDFMPIEQIFQAMCGGMHVNPETDVVSCLILSGQFERMNQLIGMENALCAFYEYPADSYGLVYWSHADGWIPYPVPSASTRWIGQDTGEGQDNRMNISDFVDVLDDGMPHFDFIMFDACFMMSVEVAYEVRNYTDYYIGSPTENPGPGAPYDKVVPYMFKPGAAAQMAEAYFNHYKDNYKAGEGISNANWTGGTSICAVRTDALDDLADVTGQLLERADNESVPSFNTVFDYDKRDMEEGHVGYYDFSQMMEMRLDADAYVAWKNVFDASIVYWNTTDKNYSMFKRMFSMKGTNGITHYIPLSVDSKAAEAYRSMAWYKAAGLENMGW